MSRIFIVLFSFALALFATNYPKLYLKGGLKAVEDTISKELSNISFWQEALKDQNLSLGYYSHDVAIALANKKAKQFRLYFYEEGKISLKLSQENLLTGLLGDKEKRGDLKTPLGFYELGKRFYPGDQYYGPFAFATTYPNLLDKLEGKTGSGIWLHGYPLDGQRLDELKTEGCVALRNKKLEEFYELVKDKELFIQIEEENTKTNIEQISALFASLYSWRQAWKDSDIQSYLSFYDNKKFKRFDKKNFEEFAKMKKRIFDKKEKKYIKFSDFLISPYPSNIRKKMFRISFYEDYRAPGYTFKGRKILYVYLDKDKKMQILAEQ